MANVTTPVSTASAPALTAEQLKALGLNADQVKAVLASHSTAVEAAVKAVPRGKRDSAEVATLRTQHAKQRLVALAARCICSDTDCMIAYQSEVAARKRASNVEDFNKLAAELKVSAQFVNDLRAALHKLSAF